MTKKLRPTRCEIFFYFNCPFCGAEINQTFQEIKAIGRFICWCGKLLEFERMYSVQVNPAYKYSSNTTQHQQQVEKPKVTTISEEHKEVIKGLTKLGFRFSQAKTAVDKTLESGIIYKTENDFFQACLKEAYESRK